MRPGGVAAHCRRQERGSTLILTLFMMGAMLAFAAIVVDLGFARQLSRQSQGATDAAALAGAQELPTKATETGVTAKSDAARDQAMRYLASDLTDNGSFTVPTCTSGIAACNRVIGDVTVVVTTPYPTPSGSVVLAHNLIHVKACRNSPQFFSGAIGRTPPRVCREAVARRAEQRSGNYFGLVALDPTACPATQFKGNGKLTVTDGAVIVDSACASGALVAQGSPTVVADAVRVVGSADVACRGCVNVTPETGVSPMGDPYASLTAPPSPGPSFSDDKTACPANACIPGTYNFAFKPKPGTYKFRSGVYVFNPGVGNDAIDTGGNVDFVMDAAFPSPPAKPGGPLFVVKSGQVSMNGNGTVNLPGYQAAPFAGYNLTIWQPSSNTSEIKLNGGSGFHIGTVYAPGANLDVSGNSGGTGEPQVRGAVITKTASFTGSTEFRIQTIELAQNAIGEADLGLER